MFLYVTYAFTIVCASMCHFMETACTCVSLISQLMINYYPDQSMYIIPKQLHATLYGLWTVPYVICSEKRDHSRYFIKIEFLAWIDSFMCAESNGASFMKKIPITSGIMTIKFFIHAGRYIRFSENAHI